jgi:hypothetical protein
MVGRLLKRIFDDDPKMRERLLLAMPIGWSMNVAEGQTTGGTFQHIPMCSKVLETGCVVTYRSFVEGTEVPPDRNTAPPGREPACVEPAALLNGEPRPYARSYFPVPEGLKSRMRGVDDVTTPFVLLRDFYQGRCVSGVGGERYLAVSEASALGDVRVSPIDLQSGWFHGELGLHILDYQFAQGDLIDLVAQRVAAMR